MLAMKLPGSSMHYIGSSFAWKLTVRNKLEYAEEDGDDCGTWWRIGWVDCFQPEGRGFDFRSSRHVGTLGKSLIHSSLWRFGVKLRHRIRAVSVAPLSSSGLEEAI